MIKPWKSPARDSLVAANNLWLGKAWERAVNDNTPTDLKAIGTRLKDEFDVQRQALPSSMEQLLSKLRMKETYITHPK